MRYIPLKATVEAMSSFREFVRVAPHLETRAIAVVTQKRKARNAGFVMI